eukprot:4306107-Pyramimonas_sp.AAC.1
MAPKMDNMAKRLWRLGVTCPSIPLLKHSVAILLLVGLPPEVNEVLAHAKKDWASHLKAAIKALDSQRTRPGARAA